MDEFQNLNLENCKISEISKNLGSSDIEDCIKQVQYLNHIQQSNKKEENEEDNIQKFRKNKNKEGDSDYDDEDDSFDSESDRDDLVSENIG